MAGQPPGHTLQATALVDEAFLRMGSGPDSGYADEQHFLRTAARAMRHVLVDHARRKNAEKRAGVVADHPLDAVVVEMEGDDFDLEALDQALLELEARNPEMARAVDLVFFGQLEKATVAEVLGLPERTFRRHWTLTLAWLRERLSR